MLLVNLKGVTENAREREKPHQCTTKRADRVYGKKSWAKENKM